MSSNVDAHQDSAPLHRCRVPWGAVRKLMTQLAADTGSSVSWGSRKGAISLAVPELETQLTPEQEAERERYDGLRLAFRPGVALNLRPLQEAWADTLAEALEGRSLQLRIEDPASWDLESLTVLRPLLGRLGPTRLGLAVGEPAEGTDARIQREVQLLRAALTVSGAPAPGEDALVLTGPWPQPLSLQETLSAYGFSSALEQARAALESGCDNPAEVHALAALALYHRDQFALSDPEIGDEFDGHMQAWLMHEKDTLRRSAAHYYLALYYGRSRRDFQRGLDYANQALQEAGDSAYHKAWSLNSRAYQLAKLGRGEEAIQDCSRALELTQDPPEPKLWWHLTGNMCQVCSETGDLDGAREWSQKQATHERDVPSSLLPPVWNYAHRDRRDLAGTAQRCRGRLEMSLTRMDLHGISLNSQILGDLTYRMGHAEEALQHFRRARLIGLVLGEDPEELYQILDKETRAALNSGDLQSAEWGLKELVAFFSSDDYLRLEFEAMLCEVQARQGETDSALQDTARVLEEARFNPGLLLHVAPFAAHVYQACGAPDLAKDIVEAVRPLAADSRAAPEDAFAALAALPQLELEEARLAVTLAPEALELAESWSSLDSLKPLLEQHSSALNGDLELVYSAAAQRQARPVVHAVGG